MARLTDVTLYDEFYPAEGQRQFQHRANYVSGLFWQGLHGYKPPRTTRISITLVSREQPLYASMAGSVACIYQHAHASTYDALADSDKLRYLLDRLHEAVDNLCRTFAWDVEVFEQSYQQVKGLHLEFPQGNVMKG